jgi:hypothetical protein
LKELGEIVLPAQVFLGHGRRSGAVGGSRKINRRKKKGGASELLLGCSTSTKSGEIGTGARVGLRLRFLQKKRTESTWGINRRVYVE